MNASLAQLQALDVPAVSVAILLLASAALVAYEPLSGKRGYARFLAAEAAEGEAARIRFYRSWIVQGCLMAAAAVALVLALPGVGLTDIGLRLPDLAGLDRFGLSDGSAGASMVGGMITGMVIGSVVLALITWAAARRRAAKGSARMPLGAVDAIAPMLPRSRAGRWGWAALSLSAGVTEEVTYRGFLVLTLTVVLPTQTPTAVLVALSGMLFGAAHLYQGRAGVLTTGIAGVSFTALYLATGSLLVPMILHTIVDLRALTLPVPQDDAASSTSSSAPALNLVEA